MQRHMSKTVEKRFLHKTNSFTRLDTIRSKDVMTKLNIYNIDERIEVFRSRTKEHSKIIR